MKRTIYSALTVPVIGIGLLCGYFFIRGDIVGSVHISADFFAEFWNLSRIVLLQFIFGFSVLAIPICYSLLFYQSLIYGYSISLAVAMHRPDLTVFYVILYFLILSVYACTSVMSVIYTTPRIKEYLRCSCVLLILQIIKTCYLILFY